MDADWMHCLLQILLILPFIFYTDKPSYNIRKLSGTNSVEMCLLKNINIISKM